MTEHARKLALVREVLRIHENGNAHEQPKGRHQSVRYKLRKIAPLIFLTVSDAEIDNLVAKVRSEGADRRADSSVTRRIKGKRA
jgi:hypothetical protein